ncbi:T-complex protein 11-like protein 1 [Chelonus insularis]|uniref:T-complex protein 11-like protein 1 n=1 Tax=Chelonus insularis TaxID=460826 RepID=UPI001589D528|nr:T-complex protein 11-like protein 1 [Chelonus insularis]XP_034937276.1 T-complex protein 11-like protein 1 [Chelonus insularis]
MSNNYSDKTQDKSSEKEKENSVSSMEWESPSSSQAIPKNNRRETEWSPNFLTAASPPKFVSLDEIINAANGIKNMALAHEIALDNNFKLEKLDDDDESNSIQKKVKKIVHEAFWNLLKEQLEENPPNFSQSLVLLREIKESLEELVLPHHTQIRDNLREVLDIDLISQQAEKGVLDFHRYSTYVLNIMSKVCAPVRDERIRQLSECTDVLETFKGIMETLQLMKLDLANFTIKMMRPNIVASSIEYEKKKFAEFLKVQADGLQYTRQWLLKYLNEKKISDASNADGIKQVTHYLLAEAYLDLLNWNASPEAETLMLDQGRLIELRNKVNRLTIIGSIILICNSTIGMTAQAAEKLKKNIKKHLDVILDSVHSNKDLTETMPNIVVQVKQDVNSILTEMNGKELDKEVESILDRQIQELINEDHRIRSLVNLRIRQFLEKTILSKNAAPLQVPLGLSSLQEELIAIAAQFCIIVAHNRSVFSEYYHDILATEIARQKSLSGSVKNENNGTVDA